MCQVENCLFKLTSCTKCSFISRNTTACVCIYSINTCCSILTWCTCTFICSHYYQQIILLQKNLHYISHFICFNSVVNLYAVLMCSSAVVLSGLPSQCTHAGRPWPTNPDWLSKQWVRRSCVNVCMAGEKGQLDWRLGTV